MKVKQKCRNLREFEEKQMQEKKKYKCPTLGNARVSPVKWWSNCEPETQERLK